MDWSDWLIAIIAWLLIARFIYRMIGGPAKPIPKRVKKPRDDD